MCHWLASSSWFLHWQASATRRISVPHQGCKQMDKCVQEDNNLPSSTTIRCNEQPGSGFAGQARRLSYGLGHLPMGHLNARPRALILRRQPHFKQRFARRYSHRSHVSSRARYCSSVTNLQPSLAKSASARARFHACCDTGGGCIVLESSCAFSAKPATPMHCVYNSKNGKAAMNGSSHTDSIVPKAQQSLPKRPGTPLRVRR